MTEDKSFQFKGRLYTFTVIEIQSPDLALFKQELNHKLIKAPKLFEDSPVVIDVTAITDQPFDLDALINIVKTQHLYLAGIQGANEAVAKLVLERQIPVVQASKTQDKPIGNKTSPTKNPEALKTKLLTSPIRSGQQAVSKGGDLVVVAAVSHGAQLLADGNIHVYGVLRGRALAGMSGNENARIFCQALEAELISIAGVYRLRDEMESVTGPCQIYLHEGQICIDKLG